MDARRSASATSFRLEHRYVYARATGISSQHVVYRG